MIRTLPSGKGCSIGQTAKVEGFDIVTRDRGVLNQARDAGRGRVFRAPLRITVMPVVLIRLRRNTFSMLHRKVPKAPSPPLLPLRLMDLDHS